jgi:hypothetical protein
MDKDPFKKIPPSILSSLDTLAREVEPGEYKRMRGSNDALEVRSGMIFLLEGDAPRHSDPIPGVHLRGYYDPRGDGESSQPVVSFLYHKLDSEGNLETTERGIVLEGIWFGVYLDHIGQEPSWYIVGPQIGTFDRDTGDLITVEYGESIEAKNFSVACVDGNPFGEPVLANPVQ